MHGLSDLFHNILWCTNACGPVPFSTHFHIIGSSQEFSHCPISHIYRCWYSPDTSYTQDFTTWPRQAKDSSLTMKCPRGISQVSRGLHMRYPTLGSEPRPLRYSSHLYSPSRPTSRRSTLWQSWAKPVTHQLLIPPLISYAHDAWFMTFTFTFTSHTRHKNHKPH